MLLDCCGHVRCRALLLWRCPAEARGGRGGHGLSWILSGRSRTTSGRHGNNGGGVAITSAKCHSAGGGGGSGDNIIGTNSGSSSGNGARSADTAGDIKGAAVSHSGLNGYRVTDNAVFSVSQSDHGTASDSDFATADSASATTSTPTNWAPQAMGGPTSPSDAGLATQAVPRNSGHITGRAASSSHAGADGGLKCDSGRGNDIGSKPSSVNTDAGGGCWQRSGQRVSFRAASPPAPAAEVLQMPSLTQPLIVSELCRLSNTPGSTRRISTPLQGRTQASEAMQMAKVGSAPCALLFFSLSYSYL